MSSLEKRMNRHDLEAQKLKAPAFYSKVPGWGVPKEFQGLINRRTSVPSYEPGIVEKVARAEVVRYQSPNFRRYKRSGM